jgi:parallel beta-helix repeat protein
VLLAPGTYTGVGNRDIDFLGKAITVTSESGQDVTIIDCQGLGRGFYFHSGEGAGSVLKGVMVTKGYALAGGGIYSTNSSLTLTNCTFARNTATETGGGMICLDSSPRFIGCTFSDNEALGEGGGGISCYSNASPTLTNCRFSGNLARGYFGGGMFSARNSFPTLTGCAFSSNEANFGGGIYCWSSTPTLTNCTLTNNVASEGAGIFCTYYSSPTLEKVIIGFNVGHAIYCNDGSPVPLICCDIYGNSGGDWVGCIADQYGINGNFSADPLFCAPENGDFGLSCTSPCASAPGCGQIGAFGVGCGPTAAQNTTWGRVKSMFR